MNAIFVNIYDEYETLFLYLMVSFFLENISRRLNLNVLYGCFIHTHTHTIGKCDLDTELIEK